MGDENWMPVHKYAEKVGKSRQQVYLDIRTGKIPSESVRRQEVVVERIRVKYED